MKFRQPQDEVVEDEKPAIIVPALKSPRFK